MDTVPFTEADFWRRWHPMSTEIRCTASEIKILAIHANNPEVYHTTRLDPLKGMKRISDIEGTVLYQSGGVYWADAYFNDHPPIRRPVQINAIWRSRNPNSAPGSFWLPIDWFVRSSDCSLYGTAWPLRAYGRIWIPYQYTILGYQDVIPISRLKGNVNELLSSDRLSVRQSPMAICEVSQDIMQSTDPFER